MKKLSVDWKGLSGTAAKGVASPQLVTAVNATLVILLAYSAAQLSWRLMPALDSEPPPPAVVKPATTQQQVATTNGGWNIARWSLFGTESKQVTPIVAPKNIPKTTLKLTLRGVFVSDVGGGAIIAGANGKEQFYGLNSKLPGGATLKEVHPTNVVLQRNNRLETLELPKESVDFGRTRSGATARTSFNRRTGGSQKSLKQYRRELMREPQRLADAINMTPHSDRGRFVGYRVNPGRDRALFDRVGLLPGDIVTAVNGIQLDTPAKGLNVLQTLQQAKSVRLDIKRNGREQSFNVSID